MQCCESARDHYHSRGWFRSNDLWVICPARFRRAAPEYIILFLSLVSTHFMEIFISFCIPTKTYYIMRLTLWWRLSCSTISKKFLCGQPKERRIVPELNNLYCSSEALGTYAGLPENHSSLVAGTMLMVDFVSQCSEWISSSLCTRKDFVRARVGRYLMGNFRLEAFVYSLSGA